MNGIILDDKVYEEEISFDPGQCDRCDLSAICDKYFSDPEDTYPCKLFAPCNKIYFRYSQCLTDKLVRYGSTPIVTGAASPKYQKNRVYGAQHKKYSRTV